MSDPSIGSYNFLSLVGNANPMSESMKNIDRAGVDGTAWKKRGKRGPLFTMESARDQDDAAASKAALANYKAYVSSLRTLTLANGQSYTNVLIHGVEEIQEHAISTSAGGLSTSAGRLQRCRWILQHTEVP